MPKETFLSVERVSGGYGSCQVICDASVEVKAGDFVGIIGPNGCGKTTLLRMASRVLAPWQGCVRLGGQDIYGMSARAFARRVAFVSQDVLFDFPFQVKDVVLMGRIPHLFWFQAERPVDFEIARRALEMTDALPLWERDINALSAGERQRVMIARALTQEPSLIFLDEPTSHLDITHQIQILDVLRRLNRQRHLSVVVVLHDLNLASAYCDRILLMNGGRIVRQGEGRDVLVKDVLEPVYRLSLEINSSGPGGRPRVWPTVGS